MASKRKVSKGKRSRARGKSVKKKNGTNAPGTLSQPQRLEQSHDMDLAESSNATGPFTDYVISGPRSSKIDIGGPTRHATLPSAPLVSTRPGPFSGKGEGRYYLLFVSTPDESLVKTRLPIEFGESSTVTIGRDPDNAIVIPDQVVSRSHAELVMKDGWVFLKDLQSTNGTFVYNGTDFQRVQDSVEVTPNSVIRFGNNTIVKLIRE